jgi:hypothetical protein
MAWIELHQGLREHRKMFACAEVLNISKIEMVGTLVCLWLWALDNAQDGSLAGVSEKTIARVCEFPEKKASKLVSALAQTGWLDYDGETYFIHDWHDYAGKLMERRAKDRERKQTGKGIRKNSDGIPSDIHGNSCATVPIPYPNRTVPYPTEENLSGDGGDIARARQASESELLSIGLKPGEFPMVTSGQVETVRNVTEYLYRKYLTMSAMPWDCRKVFKYCGETDRTALLDYAFEKAAITGKNGNWGYIDGIMERLSLRGIENVEQAREWDEERPDLPER